MKLLDISCTEMTIEYSSPISVAGRTYKCRKAYRLNIKTDSGEALSELALFENFHNQNYIDCLNAYSEIDGFDQWPAQMRYPVEAALFSLSTMEYDHADILINGYIDPSFDGDIPKMNCLKLKINRSTYKDDMKIINKIDQDGLRLDANMSLSSEEFKKYLDGLKDYDYFEEPFKNIEDIHQYPQERFALDENVLNEKFHSLKQVTTFVLKPSILGLDKTIEMIHKAKILGKSVVISSTFESELGLLNLCKIAHYSDRYLGHTGFHGLGTISFLKAKLDILRINNTEKGLQISF